MKKSKRQARYEETLRQVGQNIAAHNAMVAAEGPAKCARCNDLCADRIVSKGRTFCTRFCATHFEVTGAIFEATPKKPVVVLSFPSTGWVQPDGECTHCGDEADELFPCRVESEFGTLDEKLCSSCRISADADKRFTVIEGR